MHQFVSANRTTLQSLPSCLFVPFFTGLCMVWSSCSWHSTEAHVIEDVNRCVQALQDRDPEMIDRTAGQIHGRIARVDDVVTAEMENYQQGPYTDNVRTALVVMKDEGESSDNWHLVNTFPTMRSRPFVVSDKKRWIRISSSSPSLSTRTQIMIPLFLILIGCSQGLFRVEFRSCVAKGSWFRFVSSFQSCLTSLRMCSVPWRFWVQTHMGKWTRLVSSTPPDWYVSLGAMTEVEPPPSSLFIRSGRITATFTLCPLTRAWGSRRRSTTHD